VLRFFGGHFQFEYHENSSTRHWQGHFVAEDRASVIDDNDSLVLTCNSHSMPSYASSHGLIAARRFYGPAGLRITPLM